MSKTCITTYPNLVIELQSMQNQMISEKNIVSTYNVQNNFQ